MAAPIIYRSDDPNAPVLAGVCTSLVDILTKCLVTGYGDKLPAGWTRPYVNAELTRASFRNNPATGTGFYLMVDQATSTSANRAYFRGYELMTSESAGSFPFGYSSEVTGISATQDAKARPWVLVATDTWFYFFGYNGLTSMPTNSSLLTAGIGGNGPLVAFGDFDSILADDAYNCMLFINTPSLASGGFGRSTGAAASTLGGHYVARALEEQLTDVNGRLRESAQTLLEYQIANAEALGLSAEAIDNLKLKQDALNESTRQWVSILGIGGQQIANVFTNVATSALDKFAQAV